MKIKDVGIKVEVKGKLQPRYVYIHHSASHDVSAKEIDRWHRERGWRGIGYHFVVRQDGSIEKGRRRDQVGAHAGPDRNRDSYGICVTGNFEEDHPTKAQVKFLIALCKFLKEDDGLPDDFIRGHFDTSPTACPGRNMPLDKIKKEVSKNPPTEGATKQQLSKNFQRSEFACKGTGCCGNSAPVDDRLVQGLQQLRDLAGGPIFITSGFRCQTHNRSVGSSPTSQHTLAKAADIQSRSLSPKKLKELALQVPAFEQGGIGLYNNFLHVDVRKQRTRW